MKKQATLSRVESLLFFGAESVRASAVEKARPLEEQADRLKAQAEAIVEAGLSHSRAAMAELHKTHGFTGQLSWASKDGLVTLSWEEPDPTPSPPKVEG